MKPRLALLIVVAAATSLLACAHKPPRALDCRERIDECMDDCSQDYKLQDSCFAGCRNITCEGSEQSQSE